MIIVKRDGRQVEFDKERIINAVCKAFSEVDGELTDYAKSKADNIANYIEQVALEKEQNGQKITIEEVQDLVEHGLMSCKRKDVAKCYILYRDKRTEYRGNITDSSMLDLLCGKSEYWNTENSNKNAKVVTTQRDYLAGIASTDIARRFLLPKEVCEAHDQGIIHQHDMDYMAQFALSNCCLINLEDILQNGTVINGVKIEGQHRLLTATTVATQAITAVASSQYGGCTISLTHLAPFVRMSYNSCLERYKHRGFNDENSRKYAEEDTAKEITDAVQTFNYQINSMSTTNGQAPFISVMMYISENPEYEHETVLLIEEFIKQRIKGMPNEVGVFVTQEFPKLLYVLDENNIHADSKYYWLTELAAKCTAKRMVPDYISAKIMQELKGDVYPCINKPVPNSGDIIRKAA